MRYYGSLQFQNLQNCMRSSLKVRKILPNQSQLRNFIILDILRQHGDLNDLFNFNICRSFRCHCHPQSIQKLASTPAVLSQNVTNKSGLVYFDKCAPLDP